MRNERNKSALKNFKNSSRGGIQKQHNFFVATEKLQYFIFYTTFSESKEMLQKQPLCVFLKLNLF